MRGELVNPSLAALEPFGKGSPPAQVYAQLQAQIDARPFDGPPIREIALGEFFSASGSPEGAEYFLQRALKKVPTSAALWRNYGLSLERQGRRDAAREAYLKAVAIDPGQAAAQGALGALALDAGDLPEAERRLALAYQDGDRGAQVLVSRAALFERQGKGSEAERAWGEAILQAPGRREVLLEAARFHARRGESGEALDLYGRVLGAHPNDAPLVDEAARLAESTGEPGRAKEWREALALAGTPGP